MIQANEASSEAVLTDAVAEDRPTAAGLGETLRAAREKRALALEQVADALHLDEAIINALEQGRFETLGADVYVRGHLKAYAQLLKLPVNEFIGSFKVVMPEPVMAPKLQRTGFAPATINPSLLIGGALAILLGLLLGLYVLFADDDLGETVAVNDVFATPLAGTTVRTPSAGGEAVDSISIEAAATEVPVVVALPEAMAVTRETQGEAVDMAILPVEPPVPRPVATIRLVLEFNQESWVEISDANRRLLFGLQREGYRREVSGEPPFSLLIGNASGVALTLNDEPFDVPVARMRGNVARFEITGKE